MNFFEQQDKAKRNTKKLILLLAMAVVSLIAITSLLFAFFFYYLESNSSGHLHAQPAGGFWLQLMHSVPPQALAWIALGISSVVLAGSFFKYLQLQSGGRTVAQAMGGRIILADTQDLDERKILNVVEEMAIASGTCVPPVYLIEDSAINAFAAGFKPQDAVIGITRGSITLLSRAQLQGVIAHEFSHIYHGDMRINMRLIAILHGILLLGLIGEFLLRSNTYSRRSKNNKGAIMGFGLGLVVIGYAGTFFGNLIKAAVSRQREFLADASAVQFTRDSEGIAGALKKIAVHATGSQLENAHAAEFSHMYFGQGITTRLQLMATHPPLDERIKRIQPNWDGQYPTAEKMAAAAVNSSAEQARPGFNREAVSGIVAAIHTSQALVNTIAQPGPAHLHYAQNRLAEIPTILTLALESPLKSRAIIWGLLLDAAPAPRQAQLALITAQLDAATVAELMPSITAAAAASDELRLPLVELALPRLKQLAANEQKQLFTLMQRLINSDQEVSLREWALYAIVFHNLIKPKTQLRTRAMVELQEECQLLISLVAQAGAENNAVATNAYLRAQQHLPLANKPLLENHEIKFSAVNRALVSLNQLPPLQKPQLIKALCEVIIADQIIKFSEGELLRAIADSLDCPMPPLIIQP
jgi:Zn-dependent protease with chaperone function